MLTGRFDVDSSFYFTILLVIFVISLNQDFLMQSYIIVIQKMQCFFFLTLMLIEVYVWSSNLPQLALARSMKWHFVFVSRCFYLCKVTLLQINPTNTELLNLWDIRLNFIMYFFSCTFFCMISIIIHRMDFLKFDTTICPCHGSPQKL